MVKIDHPVDNFGTKYASIYQERGRHDIRGFQKDRGCGTKTAKLFVFVASVFLFALAQISSEANAAAITWDGGSSGTWTNAINWSTDTVPTIADDVTIDNATVTVAAATSASFFSLTIGNGTNATKLILAGDIYSESGDITINNAGTLEQQNTAQQTITGTLTINSGGVLTHTANVSTQTYIVNISVGGDIMVGLGASINVDGKGYSGGNGAGAGVSGDPNSSGAGHGGNGGNSSQRTGGTAYCDITNPSTIGSGGGGNGYGPGGSGGGLILLSATGTLTVAGTITADGSTPSDYYKGGGAGGGIKLGANVISGTPQSFTVTGGNGGGGAGGGGGGCAYIGYTTSNTLSSPTDVYFSVNGGTGGNQRGGAGQALIKKQDGTVSDLYILNGGSGPTTTQGATSVSVNTITVNNSSTYQIGAGKTLTLPGQTGFLGDGTGSINVYGTLSAGTIDTIDNLALKFYSGINFANTGTLTITSDGGLYLYSGSTVSTTAMTSITSSGTLYLEGTNLASVGTFTNQTGTSTLQSSSIPALTNLTVNGGTANIYKDFDSDNTISAFTISGGTAALYNYTTAAALNVTSLTINNGATLTHASNSSAQTHILNISASGDVAINAGGSVNVDGKGYSGGNGAGAGVSGDPNSSGAGHGGNGGNSSQRTGGTAYCDITNPSTIGSGGGGNGYGPGGSGGGLILLSATGTLTVAGTITADGSTPSDYYKGGGAGGGIKLGANVISGTPQSFTVTGGNGGGGAGGGGGGCVRMQYSASNSIVEAGVSVAGGTGGNQSGSAGLYSSVQLTPAAPTSLYSNNADASTGTTNPTNLTTLTPVFSATCFTPSGQCITANVEVDDDSNFGSPVWQSAAIDIADVNNNVRSGNITYAGPALHYNTTYYWRIKFSNAQGTGNWSTESATFYAPRAIELYSFSFGGSVQGGASANIMWGSTGGGAGETVTIQYSTNNFGSATTIDASEASAPSGSGLKTYSWTVPAATEVCGAESCGTVKIRVCSNTDTSYCAASENVFTIQTAAAGGIKVGRTFNSSGFYTASASASFASGNVSYSPAVWYDGNWTRRKAITVTNNTAGELTNFQVQIPVTYDADMQADFDDIRFTSSNMTTLIDHWLESKTDSTSATFWVKVPSIPASSTATIYMYYGNGAVASASNGTNTLEYFEDFESYANTAAMTTAGWTDMSINGAAIALSASSGKNGTKAIELDHNGGSGWRISSARYTGRQFSKGVSMIIDYNKQEDRMYTGSIGFSDTTSFGGGCDVTIGNNAVVVESDCSSTGDRFFTKSGGSGGATTANFDRTGWQTIEVTWADTSVFKRNGVALASRSTNIPASNLNLILSNFVDGSSGNELAWVDNIRVRKAASTDPTVSTGAEVPYAAPDPQTIVMNAGHTFSTITGFAATTSGTGVVKFQVSDNNGASWRYCDAGTMTNAGATIATANTTAELTNSCLAGLTPGTFNLKVFLGGDPGQTATISDLSYIVTTNRSPTAAAGPDQTVADAASVTLNGTGSSDPDGDTITYAWTQTAGTSVTLSSATAASPTFTAPDVAANTVLTFSLEVSDGTYTSTADTVNITVNAKPSATGAGAVTTAEDTLSAGITLGCSDSDSETPTKVILAAPANGQLKNDGVDIGAGGTATGVLTFLPAANWNGSTSFTYRCRNTTPDQYSDSSTVNITVTAANDTPTVGAPAASPGTTVYEGQTVTLTATGSDVDTGDSLVYTWSCTGGANFTVGAGSGSNQKRVTAVEWSGEASRSTTCTVRVTDGSGAYAEAAQILTFNDAASYPEGSDVIVDGQTTINSATTLGSITVNSGGQLTIAEGFTVTGEVHILGTLIFDLQASDDKLTVGGDFVIHDGGVVTQAVENQYGVIIDVNDPAGTSDFIVSGDLASGGDGVPGKLDVSAKGCQNTLNASIIYGAGTIQSSPVAGTAYFSACGAVKEGAAKSGGSYGGDGENSGSGGATNAIYGNIYSPTYLGASGGSSGGTAGAGGGRIWITVDGTAKIGGFVMADGGAATGEAGGGSGGSVYINAGSFQSAADYTYSTVDYDGASFKVTANGGASASGGGGGGGRMAILYDTILNDAGQSQDIDIEAQRTTIGGYFANSIYARGGVHHRDNSTGPVYIKDKDAVSTKQHMIATSNGPRSDLNGDDFVGPLEYFGSGVSYESASGRTTLPTAAQGGASSYSFYVAIAANGSKFNWTGAVSFTGSYALVGGDSVLIVAGEDMRNLVWGDLGGVAMLIVEGSGNTIDDLSDIPSHVNNIVVSTGGSLTFASATPVLDVPAGRTLKLVGNVVTGLGANKFKDISVAGTLTMGATQTVRANDTMNITGTVNTSNASVNLRLVGQDVTVGNAASIADTTGNVTIIGATGSFGNNTIEGQTVTMRIGAGNQDYSAAVVGGELVTGNAAITANAGTDQVVGKNTVVTLDGTGSSEDYVDPTRLWECTGGVSINNATSIAATFDSGNTSQAITCTLTITDAPLGITSSDTTVVTVLDESVLNVTNFRVNGAAAVTVNEGGALQFTTDTVVDPSNYAMKYRLTLSNGTLHRQTCVQLNMGAGCQVDSSSTTFNLQAPNVFTQDAYTYQMRACRSLNGVIIQCGQPASVAVTANNGPVNDWPTASIVRVVNASTGQAVVNLADIAERTSLRIEGAAVDPNGDSIATYRWTLIEKPAWLTAADLGLSGLVVDAQNLSFTAASSSSNYQLVFKLEARDSLGAWSTNVAQVTLVIICAAEATVPVDNGTVIPAPQEEQVQVQQSPQITHTVQVANVRDADINDTFAVTAAQCIHNCWGPVTITVPDNSQPYVRIISSDASENSIYRLTICINGACSQRDITVVRVDNAPIANAGADQTVSEGSMVNIMGTVSEPDLNQQLTQGGISWVQTSGPAVQRMPGTQLSNGNRNAVSGFTFTAPQLTSSQTEVLTFRLNVAGAGNQNSSDEVSITVRNNVTNEPPVVQASINPSEGTAGATITLTAVASDPNYGSSITYAWSQTGSPSVTMSPNMTSSTVTFRVPSVASDANVSFRVVVRDNGGLTAESSSLPFRIIAVSSSGGGGGGGGGLSVGPTIRFACSSNGVSAGGDPDEATTSKAGDDTPECGKTTASGKTVSVTAAVSNAAFAAVGNVSVSWEITERVDAAASLASSSSSVSTSDIRWVESANSITIPEVTLESNAKHVYKIKACAELDGYPELKDCATTEVDVVALGLGYSIIADITYEAGLHVVGATAETEVPTLVIYERDDDDRFVMRDLELPFAGEGERALLSNRTMDYGRRVVRLDNTTGQQQFPPRRVEFMDVNQNGNLNMVFTPRSPQGSTFVCSPDDFARGTVDLMTYTPFMKIERQIEADSSRFVQYPTFFRDMNNDGRPDFVTPTAAASGQTNVMTFAPTFFDNRVNTAGANQSFVLENMQNEALHRYDGFKVQEHVNSVAITRIEQSAPASGYDYRNMWETQRQQQQQQEQQQQPTAPTYIPPTELPTYRPPTNEPTGTYQPPNGGYYGGYMPGSGGGNYSLSRSISKDVDASADESVNLDQSASDILTEYAILDVNNDDVNDICSSTTDIVVTCAFSSTDEGDADTGDVVINGSAAVNSLGFSLVAGNVGGEEDSKDELVIGSPGNDKVYIFDVSAGMNGTYSVDNATTVIDGADGERFGYALNLDNDLDGDGRKDLVIGAPYADGDDLVDAGAIYIFYGHDSLERSYDSAELTRIPYVVAGEHWGSDLFTVDLTEDALGEIVVNTEDGISSILNMAKAAALRGGITIELGENDAGAETITDPKATDVAMMQFKVSNGTLNTAYISKMSIQSAGYGFENADIDAARLYYDADNDGTVSAGDTQVGSDEAFTEDNGSVEFDVDEQLTGLESRNYVVAFDFNIDFETSTSQKIVPIDSRLGAKQIILFATVAMFMGLTLALFRYRRREVRVIQLILIMAICPIFMAANGAEGGGGCSCGGSSVGDVVIDFQVAIPENGVIAADGAGEALTVTGAPIVGTVKTIE